MFRTGLSTNGKPYGEKLFSDFAEAGIFSMEISLSKTACENFDFKTSAEYAKEYGVELRSFHLPFMPFEEIDISAPALCKMTVNYLSEMIKKGADAGIGIFIVHPSGEPIADDERQLRLNTSAESLASLAETAGRCGASLAVEDLPRTCIGRNSNEILELLKTDSRLGVCLDTNHLLHENIIDFIKKTGDRIIATHISDYDGIDEKHWLPGEGINDWGAIAGALKNAGYTGAWTYEVGYKIPATITRSRFLSPADFRRNAEEIFRGAPLTRI